MANKTNLKRLIESIRNPNNKFDWLSTEDCIGAHCKRLLDEPTWLGWLAIQLFLEIDVDDAYDLYVAPSTSKRFDREYAIQRLLGVCGEVE